MFYSQNIDSLLNELNKSKVDSVKFAVLIKITDYYDNVKPEVSFNYLNQALKIAVLSKNKLMEAVVYGRIGHSMSNEEKFDTAILFFEKAKIIYKSIDNNLKEADMKLNIAAMQCSIGKNDEALIGLNEALNYYKANNQIEREAMVYSNISEAYDNLGQLNKAIGYLLKALTIYDKNNLNSRKGKVLNDLANILSAKRDYKKALDYAFQGLKIRQENNDFVSIASSYVTLGSIFGEMNDNKNAIVYMRKTVDLYKELNIETGVAVSYNNLGIVYETINMDSSVYFYKEALKIHRKFQNQYDIASCLTNLGRVYLIMKMYKETLECIEESGEISVKTKNHLHLKAVYNLAADYYYNLKDYKKAYEYFAKFSIINDSILNTESSRQMSEMEAKYQNEKKSSEINMLQKESTIQEAEIKKQNAFKLAYGIGFGLMIILSVVIFRSYRQKKNDHKIILFQKELVDEKQKEIVDSINYAKRIQNTLLAHNSLLNENLPEYFVFFHPKDIVSGDFYWATKKANKFYLAVCDSTGHGVPGAFMSLLNISFLNEAINEKNIEAPNEVFNYVRSRLIANVSQEGAADGMDGILLCVETDKGGEVKTVTYSSANSAPVVVSSNGIIESEKDKMPVGKGGREEDFKNYSLTVTKGDMLFLYTDGFADQFGGPKGKKYRNKQLNELLLTVSTQQIHEQKEKVEQEFLNWKGNVQQIDDVCVIGIRI